MRETTAAIDDSGCWCLMVAMDGKMKIVYHGVGDVQRQGGGQTMVQCWQWVATVQWWTALVAAMVNGNGGGGGQ
jgi:hypothetical protein